MHGYRPISALTSVMSTTDYLLKIYMCMWSKSFNDKWTSYLYISNQPLSQPDEDSAYALNVSPCAVPFCPEEACPSTGQYAEDQPEKAPLEKKEGQCTYIRKVKVQA
jgi:hypothetical protein